jgi:AraC-like DNA-binding protein
LPHSAGVSPARYRKAFGCTVFFEQPFDALIFPSGLLDVKIDQANDDLRRKAERYVNDVVQRFPLDIGKQTSALVDRHLATGHFGLRDIARQLSLHERTLQRRLSEQDLVFEDIVDHLRRERASEYLRSSAIPLTQVAAFLGYSNQAAFTRACRRWFGDSPQRLRRR